MTGTKYLRLSTYKEKRFILAHSFGSFNPWLSGLTVLGPLGKQYLMALWQRVRSKAELWDERETGRELGPTIPFKGTLR
jgi:hypothetical protein